jgi:hypothetical protein
MSLNYVTSQDENTNTNVKHVVGGQICSGAFSVLPVGTLMVFYVPFASMIFVISKLYVKRFT